MVLVIASNRAAVLVILATFASVSQMLKAEFTYSCYKYLCQDQIVQVDLLVGLCIILCLPIYKATLDIFNGKCFSTSLKQVGSCSGHGGLCQSHPACVDCSHWKVYSCMFFSVLTYQFSCSYALVTWFFLKPNLYRC